MVPVTWVPIFGVVESGDERRRKPTARNLYKAGYITPAPGGVGPMTVAMLLRNKLRSAQILYES
jgi:hypothetical protein